MALLNLGQGPSPLRPRRPQHGRTRTDYEGRGGWPKTEAAQRCPAGGARPPC